MPPYLEEDICTGGKLALFYVAAVLGGPLGGLVVPALVGIHDASYLVVAVVLDLGIVAGIGRAFRAIWQDVVIAAIVSVFVGAILFGVLLLVLLSSIDMN